MQSEKFKLYQQRNRHIKLANLKRLTISSVGGESVKQLLSRTVTLECELLYMFLKINLTIYIKIKDDY